MSRVGLTSAQQLLSQLHRVEDLAVVGRPESLLLRGVVSDRLLGQLGGAIVELIFGILGLVSFR